MSTQVSPQLTVDDELRDYMPGVPKITDEVLEASLIASGGPIHPIVVWKGRGIVVDGHRRLKFCLKNGLPYTVLEKEFVDHDEIKAWMDITMLERRNYTDSQYALAVARHCARELAKQSAPLGQGGKKAAADATAKAFGISNRSVARANKFAKAYESLSPEMRQVAEDEGLQKPIVIAFAAHPLEQQQHMVAQFRAGEFKTLRDAIVGVGEEPEEDDVEEEDQAEESPGPADPEPIADPAPTPEEKAARREQRKTEKLTDGSAETPTPAATKATLQSKKQLVQEAERNMGYLRKSLDALDTAMPCPVKTQKAKIFFSKLRDLLKEYKQEAGE